MGGWLGGADEPDQRTARRARPVSWLLNGADDRDQPDRQSPRRSVSDEDGAGPAGARPDLVFVANAHLDRLHGTFLEGPADIAVEVISPGSVYRDREEKCHEYEQGGVREYWLLDPQARQAGFFELGEDGRYHPIPLEESGIFRSRVIPEWRLNVEWLWEPRPKLLDILRAWELI